MKFSTFFKYFFVTVLSCGLFSAEIRCSLDRATKMISEIGRKFEEKQDEFEKIGLDWISEAINKDISFDGNQGPINILNDLRKSNNLTETIKTSIEKLKTDLDKRNEKTNYVQLTDQIIGLFLSHLSEKEQIKLRKELELPVAFPQELEKNYKSIQKRFEEEKIKKEKSDLSDDIEAIKNFFLENFVNNDLTSYVTNLINQHGDQIKIEKVSCKWSDYDPTFLETCMKKGILGSACTDKDKNALLVYCLKNCLGNNATKKLFLLAINIFSKDDIKTMIDDSVIKSLLTKYAGSDKTERELICKIIASIDNSHGYEQVDLGTPFWSDFYHDNEDLKFLELLIEKKLITTETQFYPTNGRRPQVLANFIKINNQFHNVYNQHNQNFNEDDIDQQQLNEAIRLSLVEQDNNLQPLPQHNEVGQVQNNNGNQVPKSSLRLFFENNKTSIGVGSALSFGIVLLILWQKRGTLWTKN